MLRRLLASSLAMMAGCSLGHLEQRTKPDEPFDAVIVLGCPSREDGHPSRCQLSRAIWAATLWERGWAKRFITSGSDVHTPFVEAEALAQVMVALGVPPEHIYLESEALHTDENMYYSMRIAHALGLRTIGVASQPGHAHWACRMMLDWGQACRALPVDYDVVEKRHAAGVEALVARKISPWRPMVERERAEKRHRPASWMLYSAMVLMKLRGEPWTPKPPTNDVTVRTYADELAAEMATSPVAPATR